MVGKEICAEISSDEYYVYCVYVCACVCVCMCVKGK